MTSALQRVRPRSSIVLAATATLALFAVVRPSYAQRPAATPPRPVPTAEARLEPGDLVRVTVWRKPEFSGEFTIDPGGSPRHPLYKDVRVTGVPIAEAERRLVEFLRGYEQNPQVVVEPLFRVAVSGEVNAPSLLTLPRETTILQAIALAGGPRERGRLDRVRIVRGGQSIEADLTVPTSEWANRTVLSGDQIVLTRRRNLITEVVTPAAAIIGAAAALINIVSRR